MKKENHDRLDKRSNSDENSVASSKSFNKLESKEEDNVSLRITKSKEEGKCAMIDRKEDSNDDKYMFNKYNEDATSIEDAYD